MQGICSCGVIPLQKLNNRSSGRDLAVLNPWPVVVLWHLANVLATLALNAVMNRPVGECSPSVLPMADMVATINSHRVSPIG